MKSTGEGFQNVAIIFKKKKVAVISNIKRLFINNTEKY